MAISIDELGIWGNLGSIIPQLDYFTPFPSFSNSQTEIFRLTASSNCPDFVKVWVKQTIGGIDLTQWRAFYPRPNQSIMITLPYPETFQDRGLSRQISVKKSFKYLSDSSFIDFSLTLEDFTSFVITRPGLSEQEKTYLDQLLRQYIQESAQTAIAPQQLPPP